MRLRIFRKHSSNPSSVKKSVKGLFRKSSGSASHQPSIQPAVTLTLSEDIAEYNDEPVENITNKEPLTIDSPKVQQISQYVFTEADLMANELNHMRELEKKQQEIVKMQVVHDELREKLQQKEEELEQYKTLLTSTETQLNDAETENVTIKTELSAIQTSLAAAKKELNIVGSTLIRCQHELEERKSRHVLLDLLSC